MQSIGKKVKKNRRRREATEGVERVGEKEEQKEMRRVVERDTKKIICKEREYGRMKR
jgi:hypothetical protein